MSCPDRNAGLAWSSEGRGGKRAYRRSFLLRIFNSNPFRPSPQVASCTLVRVNRSGGCHVRWRIVGTASQASGQCSRHYDLCRAAPQAGPEPQNRPAISRNRDCGPVSGQIAGIRPVSPVAFRDRTRFISLISHVFFRSCHSGLHHFGLRGGQDGIRTHETLLGPTPLAGERLRPLGHLPTDLVVVGRRGCQCCWREVSGLFFGSRLLCLRLRCCCLSSRSGGA